MVMVFDGAHGSLRIAKLLYFTKKAQSLMPPISIAARSQTISDLFKENYMLQCLIVPDAIDQS